LHQAFDSSMEMKHEIFNLLRQHQLNHLPLISGSLLRFNAPPFPDNISHRLHQSDLSTLQLVKFRRPGRCHRIMESRNPTIDLHGLADAGPIYVRDADE
jgi:hypothetical protein